MRNPLTKYQKKTLYKKLRHLDTIPGINSGGCAIVASHLQDYLKREFGVSYEVYYFFEDIDNIFQNRSYNNLLNGVPDSCCHAMVKIGSRYFDTKCGVTGKGHSKADLEEFGLTAMLEIPKDLLLKSIKKGKWNRIFHRKTGIPRIKAILG